ESLAESYLEKVTRILHPPIKEKHNLETYQKRASNLGCRLINIKQSHLGTDGGLRLIKELIARLENSGVEISLGEEVLQLDSDEKTIKTNQRTLGFENIIFAPGRKGFGFLQKIMKGIDVSFLDHIVDIGVRIETKEISYPIVKDYYDPKFIFPQGVRTFCTNSGAAYVVKEKYSTRGGETFYSVNGHAYSDQKKQNGLVNFAMLKTVRLTEPLASGQGFVEMLGLQSMLLGGGQPIMQRMGDFRMGSRSKVDSFNNDLYDFEPTLKGCTPGDIALAMPGRVLRAIWKSMKQLDTIIPGVLHPSTIMYYPEIKLYANKPVFKDQNFKVAENIYMIGDGAGTSRGITGAWASGIRAAEGILG
ncbi:MAG: pyridine nucleotide-disulfide oxidoreductase, partial [Spirochaetaceae bacterium]|nr:pyridine nucleotide-disulfide oxidoreductase [Spirochaetaceae bacterium]